MAAPFSVRIFGYQGIIQVHQSLVKQFSSDSVFLLEEPYLWSQLIAVAAINTAYTSTVVALNPDKSTILRIEVPDAQQIRYEINPNGPTAPNARVAGNTSPRLSGFDQFSWGAGYSISIADASGYL